MSLKKKLDKILKRLDQIDERINKIGQNFDKANARIDNVKSEFKDRIDKFDRYFIQSKETMEKLNKRIKFLENFKPAMKKLKL